MPVRTDAIGSRFLLSLFGMALMLPVGCLGARAQPKAARGSPEPASVLPIGDSPIDIKPPPPPIPGEPVSFIKDEPGDSPLKRLALKAAEGEKKLNNYMVRIRRRELLDGKTPDETIMLKYRRTPLSVHLKWLGDEARGREILFVQGQHDNKIHLLTGKGDLLGAGHHMTFDLDSPLVRSKSHYPITEAGLGAATLRFAMLMDAIERGQANAGTARYLGYQNRAEFPRMVEAVEQTLPPGLEPFLPRGGTRYYYFDEQLSVPTVIYTLDANKQEVEYYHFDRLQTPVNLDDNDFDPAVLWRR
jgi:hypothetical protein